MRSAYSSRRIGILANWCMRVGGPVVVLAHHLAHLVEELRKALRLGPLFRKLARRRLHHVYGHRRAHMAHALLGLRIPAGLGIRRRNHHQPPYLVRMLDRRADRSGATERV